MDLLTCKVLKFRWKELLQKIDCIFEHALRQVCQTLVHIRNIFLINYVELIFHIYFYLFDFIFIFKLYINCMFEVKNEISTLTQEKFKIYCYQCWKYCKRHTVFNILGFFKCSLFTKDAIMINIHCISKILENKIQVNKVNVYILLEKTMLG